MYLLCYWLVLFASDDFRGWRVERRTKIQKREYLPLTYLPLLLLRQQLFCNRMWMPISIHTPMVWENWWLSFLGRSGRGSSRWSSSPPSWDFFRFEVASYHKCKQAELLAGHGIVSAVGETQQRGLSHLSSHPSCLYYPTKNRPYESIINHCGWRWQESDIFKSVILFKLEIPKYITNQSWFVLFELVSC